MKKFFLILLSLFLTVASMAQNAIVVNQISEQGNPIIFLPHIGCSSEMWNEIAAHYKNTHSVYLVDFAGFNGQKAIDSPYTEKYVNALSQYIKGEHLKNIILVGQNYGAFVAVKLAIDNEVNIKAIIASDFYPKLSMVIDRDITPEKLEKMKTGIRRGSMQADDTTFTANQRQTAEMMNFSKAEDINRFVQWQQKSDRKTLAETLCEQLESNLLPQLKNNKTPMLVFTTWYFAKKYRNMTISEADSVLKEMYGDTPNVIHKVTEEAKDFIPNDQPEWFIGEADNFLKAVN
ncbi:MAG: alpha/beta hydrolase [Chitinophagaceae bacterium]|nr:alpha/beta hydrolase [Chitinophagaceae bacterium]